MNDLIVRTPEWLAVIDNRREYEVMQSVSIEFQPEDDARFSFSYNLSKGIDAKITESDRNFSSNDYIDAEFCEDVPEKEWPYYSVAAASGVLTGLLSVCSLNTDKLSKVKEWTEKEWQSLIVAMAQNLGFKKKDYSSAVKYIYNRFVSVDLKEIPEQYHDFVKTWRVSLSSHPSIVGLIFSVITQFSEERYSFDEKGKIIGKKLPKYYAIGMSTADKILYGLIYWVFNIVTDAVISQKKVFENSGLPEVLIKTLKLLKNASFMNKLPSSVEEAEESVSSWIKKYFEAELESSDAGSSEPFNLFKIIKQSFEMVIDSSFPVVLNECIVRGFYMFYRLAVIAKEQCISSLDGLFEIHPDDILPFNNRIVSRMCLISSATFTCVNVGGAVLKAIKDKNHEGEEYSEKANLEISIAGIGRFIFACVEDCKYWRDDLKVLFTKDRHANDSEPEVIIDDESETFDELVLDGLQAQMLYSLKALSVEYDADNTDKADQKNKKREWLKNWKAQIALSQGLQVTDYFVSDEDVLYDGIYTLSRDKGNWRWFYLLTMELALFEPYFPLSTENDGQYKRLKYEHDYLRNRFVRRQTIVSQDEVDNIIKSYKEYCGKVSGRTRNTAIGIGATAVAVVATGGLALAFAPQIAVLLAGEAVLGLHGAALTSASLALVGGGSLAAGGLGMAGGTAIIAGGGAALGLAGTGSASLAVIFANASGNIEKYLEKQFAKLVTFSDCVLLNVLKDDSSVKALSSHISAISDSVEKNVTQLKSEKNDLNDEEIKIEEIYLKYLKNAEKELYKIVK